MKEAHFDKYTFILLSKSMFVEKKIINMKDLQIFILNFNLIFCNLILFINAMR